MNELNKKKFMLLNESVFFKYFQLNENYEMSFISDENLCRKGFRKEALFLKQR